MTPSVSSLSPEVVIRWVDGESVTVEGAVHSFAAHQSALHTAWDLPGVRRVYDGLAIRLAHSTRKDD